MTLNDLKQEVASLGFESEIENSEVLIRAAKRALGTLYTEYSVICNARINRNMRKPSFHAERIDILSDRHELSVRGACYSFTTTGRGYYTITDKAKTTSKSFATDGEIHRGFIEGGDGATIRFNSNYTCSVLNLAVFDSLHGVSIDDIPLWTPIIEYDLRHKFPDFGSFVCPPKDDNAR